MQRLRFGDAFGENVAWRRLISQFSSWFLLDRRSAADEAPSPAPPPPGPPNIGEKSVKRATRKSRERVIAEDNILLLLLLLLANHTTSSRYAR